MPKIDHGEYDYAKRFYEEAYRFAVLEAGREEYILSAVIESITRQHREQNQKTQQQSRSATR